MKWGILYREGLGRDQGLAGEIRAVVEAETQEEAILKFLAGDVESVTVNYLALWPDYVEAAPMEE